MQDRFKFRYVLNNEVCEVLAFDISDGIEHKCLFLQLKDGTRKIINDYDWSKFNQCTGLKDKNGKLIYEGDILRYPPENKDEEKNYVACEVFFHNNDCCDNHIGFQMNRYRFQGCLCGIANYGTRYKFIPKNTERMEVIGNIYENPELLEVEE